MPHYTTTDIITLTEPIMNLNLKKQLHWTTTLSERALLALIGALTMMAALSDVYSMYEARRIELADLFLLFIYAEIIGMVGAFYSTSRIPVTLPIIVAITALCRLIVLHSKESDPINLGIEALAILLLSAAAYIMSAKDRLSISKLNDSE